MGDVLRGHATGGADGTSGLGPVNLAKVDSSGNIYESLGTNIAGEDIPNDVLKTETRGTYLNIVGAATTVVKTGAGELYSITVNTAIASATITIYDNTAGSGTKIGTVTMPATLLQNHFTLTYNAAFSTGLTIVTTGANLDITVSRR